MVLEVAWCCPCGEISDGKGHRGYPDTINALFLELGAGYQGVSWSCTLTIWAWFGHMRFSVCTLSFIENLLRAILSYYRSRQSTKTIVQIEVLLNLLLLTFYFPGAKLLFLGHIYRFHFLSSLEFQNDFSFYSFLDLAAVLILASLYPAQTNTHSYLTELNDQGTHVLDCRGRIQKGVLPNSFLNLSQRL